MKLRLLLFVSFLAVAGLVGNASAVDYTWDGGGVGDNFTTPENWDPCGVPGPTCNFYHDDPCVTIVIDSDINTFNATIGDFHALGAHGVKLIAGTWSLDNSGSITIGNQAGSSATVTIEGGTIDHPWNFAVGHAGKGTLTMTGGMIKNPAAIWMGGYLTYGVGYGTLNLLGGTIEQPIYWAGAGIDADGEINVDGGLWNACDDTGPGFDTGIILGNSHCTTCFGPPPGGAPAKGKMTVDSGTVKALFIVVSQDPQTEGYLTINGGSVYCGDLGLHVARKINSKGRVYVHGGTLSLRGALQIAPASAASVHNAYINITDGVIEINDPNGSRAADANQMVTDGYLAGYGQCDTDHVIISYDMMSQLTTITAVPEPSTIALLGLGSAVFFRRRKRS